MKVAFPGQIISSGNNNFEEISKELINLYNLPRHIDDKTDFPYGTQIYFSNNRDFVIFCNYDDHLIVCNKILKHSIIDSINNLENLIDLIDSKCKLKTKFSNDFGYLTNNPNFSGTGLSISYYLKDENNYFKPSEEFSM